MLNCPDAETIETREMDCYDAAWNDWYASGHKYALRDKEFMERGLDEYLNFVEMFMRKKA